MDPDFKLTDIHIHFCAAGRYDEFLLFCETAGISRAGLVSLPDLKLGTFNDAVLTALKQAPGRFIGFGCLDYRKSRLESEGARQVKQLAADGFSGLKLWLGKPQVQEEFRVSMEDELITGALKAAGHIEFPVLIHLADPPPFWNEGGPCYGTAETAGKYGTFDSWIERGRELFIQFPEVTFLGAHLLFLGGALLNINEIMESHPNLLLDTAPGRWFFRPLGEQKNDAEMFFRKYGKRILLGSDSMFFPREYAIFSDPGLAGNQRTFSRIQAFLGGTGGDYDGTIDDPFPSRGFGKKESKDAKSGILPCLELPDETVELIFGKNAEMMFNRRDCYG